MSTIFGISPGYNFQNDQITFRNLTRFYGIFLTSVLLLLQMTSIKDSFKYNNISELITSKIVSLINSIFLTMSAVTIILSSCIFNQDKWLALNKNFQFVDKKLNNRNKQSRVFYKNFNFQYFVIILWFGAVQVYIFFGFVYPSGYSLRIGYWLHQTGHICEMNTIFLTHTLLTIFKIRFEDLNKIFESNKISVCLIRDSACIFRALNDNVTNFNKIFGWSLIFLFGRIVLQLLSSLGFILYALRENFVFDQLSTQILAIISFSTFIYMLVIWNFRVNPLKLISKIAGFCNFDYYVLRCCCFSKPKTS